MKIYKSTEERLLDYCKSGMSYKDAEKRIQQENKEENLRQLRINFLKACGDSNVYMYNDEEINEKIKYILNI